jgi:F420-non-reducing hydrogenase iron-sulfur subunit
MRLIRVMCSGRVDLEFLLRAFANGQDGVLVGGCKLDECNYVTHGNYDALANVHLCKKIMARIGLNPERLRIEFMSGADGGLLADVTNDFTRQVKALGPLGKSEGMDENDLGSKLKAARKLVPYIKLVERERFRMPSKSKEAYHEFFTSDEFDRLFDELIGDQLAVSQMMSLLENKPLSTGEIAEALSLNPSEIAKYINSSSRQGLVKYDENAKSYALA